MNIFTKILIAVGFYRREPIQLKGRRFVVYPSFTYWEVDGKPSSFKEAKAAWEWNKTHSWVHHKIVKCRPTEIALHPELYC